MAFKFIVLTLSVLLFLQTTYSAPVEDKDESSDLAEATSKIVDEIAKAFKQIADRFGIIGNTLDELVELHLIVNEKGPVVLRKVLEDPKVVEIKNDAMEKYVKEIREYAEKLEKDERDSKSRLTDYLDYEEFVSQFKKDKNENLSHEAEIIGNSLKENGLDELEKAVTDHFNKFSKKFTEQTNEFIKELSDEEKKEEQRLVDWFNKFVAEDDFIKKLDIFDDFFAATSEDSDEKSKEN